MVTKEELTPGTRIRFRPEYTRESSLVLATVVKAGEDEPSSRLEYYAFFMRDDRVPGGGLKGEWLVPWGIVGDFDIELLASEFSTAGSFPKSQPAHRMGLDPETIDPDAYRDFMRSL